MRSKYYYFDLAKIRIGPAGTTKIKLPLPDVNFKISMVAL